MDRDHEREWRTTLAQIEQRWDKPGYWTEARKADLEALKPLNQEILREALRLVLVRYSSADQRFNMKWILDIYNELYDDRFPRQTKSLAEVQADKLAKIESMIPEYDREKHEIMEALRNHPRDDLAGWRDRFLDDCPWADDWHIDKKQTDDPDDWGMLFCGLLFSYMSKAGQRALNQSRSSRVNHEPI